MGGARLERATSCCKARAPAAVYCRLSLRTLGERCVARGCCPLLRFAASRALPHELLKVGERALRSWLSRAAIRGASSLSSAACHPLEREARRRSHLRWWKLNARAPETPVVLAPTLRPFPPSASCPAPSRS